MQVKFTLWISLTLLLGTPGHAQTWDLTGDWNPPANPNGAWTYGEFVGGVFAPLDWRAGGYYPAVGASGGYITENTTGSAAYGIDPGQISLEADGGSPVVRWTAPSAGGYNIDVFIGGTTASEGGGYGNNFAKFAGLNINGVSQGSNGFSGNVVSWVINDVVLNAGATVDAYVMNPGYANGGNTEAMFTVTAVQPTATATATVVNGYVVEATVTSGGYGYTNTPGVSIIGGGGSGAEAVAVVSNEVVIAVDIVEPGEGYTNTPVMVIAPPFILQPKMAIAPWSLLSFTNLAVGTNYQLQVFAGGSFVTVGAPFAATSSTLTQLVSGAASANGYRLVGTPLPFQAQATADVVGGFVVGATVTSGGSGYTTNPAVTILGNGAGSNATAVATVSGGSVSALAITSPGIGYANGATIVIAPPPTTALWPSNVTQVMELELGNLSPYVNYQLQFSPVATGRWSTLNTPFTPTSSTYTQYLIVTGNAGFFRVLYLP